MKAIADLMSVRTALTDRGYTCHHIAAKHGHLSIVKWLDAHYPGGHVVTRNEEGSTALALACCEGHLEIVQYLWSPYSASIADRHGLYPVEKALLAHKIDVVAWILSSQKSTMPSCVLSRLRIIPGQALTDLIEAGTRFRDGTLELRNELLFNLLSAATKRHMTYKIIEWFVDLTSCQALFIRNEMFLRNAIACNNTSLVVSLLSYGSNHPLSGELRRRNAFPCFGASEVQPFPIKSILASVEKIKAKFVDAVRSDKKHLAKRMLMKSRVNLQPTLVMATWEPHICLRHFVVSGEMRSWALPESPMNRGKYSMILRMFDSFIKVVPILLVIIRRNLFIPDLDRMFTAYIMDGRNADEWRNVVRARHAVYGELNRALAHEVCGEST